MDYGLPELRKKLREMIIEKGLSAHRLAEDIGISRITLMTFIEGKVKPTWKTLQKLDDYIKDKAKNCGC